MILNILAICIGLIFLIVGAEFLIRGSSTIAQKFCIPEILIGLTIVSIGTSMPELIITVNSSLQGRSDLIVGNSIGSDLCNLLLILGLMAVIRPIKITKETKKFHLPIAFLSTLLILFFSTSLIPGRRGVITRHDGVILIILFIAYLLYPILLDRKKIVKEYKKAKKEGKNTKINLPFQICLIGLGIVLLKLGGDYVVDYATKIAQDFGVSEAIIGLTIVAIGTALPELVTSIVAVINNDEDIGVGNLIGSSVLNSFLIFGVGASINPITISEEFISNEVLLAASTALIWAFCYIPKKDTLTRSKGFILILLFALYMVSLFI